MKKLFIAITILSVSALFFACDKTEDTTAYETQSENAEKVTAAETTIEAAVEELGYEVDLFSEDEKMLQAIEENNNVMPEEYQTKGHGRAILHQCPSITINSEPGGFPKTITFNYGDSTMLNGGFIVSGVIEIYMSSPLIFDGAERSVTFTNFVFDTLGINGVRNNVFTGDYVNSRLYTIVSNMDFTFPDGSEVNRQENLATEWVGGLETIFNPLDDVILINGDITIIYNTIDIFIKEITDPLMKKGDCRWIVQGVIEFIDNGNLLLTIDYGNGECDDIAIVTYEGVEYELTIGKGKWRRRG